MSNHPTDHDDDDLSEEINAVATAYAQNMAHAIGDTLSRTLRVLGHEMRIDVDIMTHAVTLYPRDGGDPIDVPPQPPTTTNN